MEHSTRLITKIICGIFDVLMFVEQKRAFYFPATTFFLQPLFVRDYKLYPKKKTHFDLIGQFLGIH